MRFAFENNGWNCTLECEVHVSAPGAPAVVSVRPAAPLPGLRGGASCANLLQRPGSNRGARRESFGIPRFFSRPIPARSAFATDSDTPPPPDRPRSPARTIMTTPTYEPAAPGEKCPFEQTITAALSLYVFNHP